MNKKIVAIKSLAISILIGSSSIHTDAPVFGTQVYGHTPETVTLKNKSAKPLYLAIFEGTYHKPQSITMADGSTKQTIEIKPNEALTFKASRKPHGEWWVMYTEDQNSFNIPALLTKNNKDKDRQMIALLNDTISNLVKANDGEMFLLFKNNQGLIPGLLRGAGDLGDRTKVKINKLCALRSQYFDKNGASVPTPKPAEYASAVSGNARASSQYQTIEDVFDDVLAFEAKRGIS